MVYLFPCRVRRGPCNLKGAGFRGKAQRIRATLIPTSVEGLNFVVRSDELRRKSPLRCRNGRVTPYAGPLPAAMVGIPEQPGRRDARVIEQRHLLSLLGAASAALVLSLGALAPTAGAARTAAKPHKLTNHQKAVARRQLRRALKRNPNGVLGRNFLKKAQLVDLTLPLTLRLRRSGAGLIDDELGVEWSSQTFPWPNGFAELANRLAATLRPAASSRWTERRRWRPSSATTCRATRGRASSRPSAGGKVAFDSGPIGTAIAVSDYAPTASDNIPLCNAPTVQVSNVVFGTGRATQSVLHLFGGTARVTFARPGGDHNRWFRRRARAGLGPRTTCTFRQRPDPIVPISFDATFKISPAVTTDGKLRLGVLTVRAGSAQPTTFARITMCVDEAATCSTRAFPARLKVLRMTPSAGRGPLRVTHRAIRIGQLHLRP